MLEHFMYNSVCLTKKTLIKKINPSLSKRLWVIRGCCAPWFSCRDPASSLSHWIMGIKAAACSGTSVICLSEWVNEPSPGPWNVAAAPGVAYSPGRAQGSLWCGFDSPRAGQGSRGSLCPTGLLPHKEKGLDFFPAAGDPLSAGELLLERAYWASLKQLMKYVFKLVCVRN